MTIGIGANFLRENSADNPYYDGNISEFDESYTDPKHTFGPNLALELFYELSERLDLSAEFNNYYYFDSSFPKYRYSIAL